MTKLTPKQEKFVQSIVKGINQSDAYRSAYKVGLKTKIDTVNNNAYLLMQNTEIATRIEELRKPVVKKAQITLESHLARLQSLGESAEAEKQFSASITAEVARGKASGIHVERSELTGKDGGPQEHTFRWLDK